MDEPLYRPLSLSRRKDPHAEVRVDWSPPATIPPAQLRVTFVRTLRWCVELHVMFAQLAWAWITGRPMTRAFGVSLREMFRRMGGTAVKLGQQLSLRIDFLPPEVCEELGALTDRVGPIPFEEARRAVESAIGGTIESRFERFEREPIGAASIACVYRAVLKSGDVVAVKVQRPTAPREFASDLQVFDAYTRALEALGVVRPGFFEFMRREVRAMFLEELDFAREARYQKLYRTYALRDGLDWLTAPKVYPELSGGRVMVSEFIDGLSCAELIRLAESDDPRDQGRLRERGIEPARVAERILLVSVWSRMESPFFHADPHPANILITSGGRLCMIDFGSCGTNPSATLRNHAELLPRLLDFDADGALDVMLRDLAPLPRVDAATLSNELRKRLLMHQLAWADRPTRTSQGARWWERTTASIWVANMEVAQRFEIPVNLDTLRFMRATMAYDTLAYRIDPQVSDAVIREQLRDAEGRFARRVVKRARRDLGRARVPFYDRLVHLARLVDRAEVSRTSWQASARGASQLAVWAMQLGVFALVTWALAAAVVLWRSGLSFDALWQRPIEAMSRHPVGALALAAGAVIALSFMARVASRLRQPEQR